MIYFDSSYLVRLYYRDPGFEAVRELAARERVACSFLGRVETAAALHRKYREGNVTASNFKAMLTQFTEECAAGAFRWYPISTVMTERAAAVFMNLSARNFLRGADALHLACASESGFREIYSNDAKLLAAAHAFGMSGRNILP